MDPITQMKGQKFFEDACPFPALFIIGFFVVMTVINIYRMPLIESLFAYGPPTAVAFLWARKTYKKSLILNRKKLVEIEKRAFVFHRHVILYHEQPLYDLGSETCALVDAILTFVMIGFLIGPIIWLVLAIMFTSIIQHFIIG